MTTPSIGFLGFGEAAFGLAKGLGEAGIASLVAHDSAVTGTTRERARQAHVRLVPDVAQLAQEADVVFSAVVSQQALAAARSLRPHLEERHWYVDVNSVSPAVKLEIARLIEETPARFVEAAILSGVPRHGHRVPMLLGGTSAYEFVDLMTPYGMELEAFGDRVGPASAVKMFRSVMVKGIEALALECLLGASFYGVEDRVFESLGKTFPGLDWNALAHYLVGRTAVHGDRRGREMEEASATLRELGVEPWLAEASAKRLLDTARSLAGRFSEAPPSYREVIEALKTEER